MNSSCKKEECIGQSVCGNSSKIHMLSDSHGNPLNFIISEGQNLIANRAYSDQKISSIDKTNDMFDKYLYKTRHLVEILFTRLKQFRSISTRYDKSKNNFASMIYIGRFIMWAKI